MVYKCECCNYNTTYKANYSKHLKTEKHLLFNKTLNTNASIVAPASDQFVCKYCAQEFTFKQSMFRHIKYSCTKNKDEDLKELVRLLNAQLEQQRNDFQTQLQSQAKQIEKLMGKLEINGSFNTTNIQNNIQLLAYKDTDISHLTEKDYVSCIKKVNFCVKNLIERIHFNPEKPENMNIYISNLKDKYLMIYEDGNWNIKHKTELDMLYEEKEMLLEEWLDEEQDKYPELKDKFIRYLNNKENDETLNMIKDEIKLMMYNSKKSIKA